MDLSTITTDDLLAEPVYAANRWQTNGHLIADCHRLGYLQDDWRTLDPTYGRGTWWKVWRPSSLTTHDLAQDGVDFRSLPYDDGEFDAVAYDPPYVSTGSTANERVAAQHHALYGIGDDADTPQSIQALINDGLVECARVVKTKGYVLVKCQDYIKSGKYWNGTYLTMAHGISIGLEVVDRLEHITSPRVQPHGRRQVHARRNLSTLIVFSKRRAALEVNR